MLFDVANKMRIFSEDCFVKSMKVNEEKTGAGNKIF